MAVEHYFICPHCGHRSMGVDRNAGFRKEARGCEKCGFAYLYELRDEGMLKLFFSDFAPETRLDQIRVIRATQEAKLAQLRAIEPHAKEGREGPLLTLRLGIALTESIISWCEEAERALAAPR